MDKVPYSKQSINQEDIRAVNSVLKSKFLTTGPKIEEFEKKLSKFSNSKYALTVNSATSALHISCLALGLNRDDYLWTTPISFVASANCGLYCGAKIDFVDIDNDTFNISLDCLKKKLTKTPKSKLPKILVVVHLSGHPVDMIKVKSLSKQYNFKIIEDASHAIGSAFNGTKIGSCTYSDICVYSFHPVKIITTGEGGAILTNSQKIYNKVMKLRAHGIQKKIKSKNNPWFYDQKILGFNYRMTDIEAALGISQLSRIKKFVIKRNIISNLYKKLLNKKGIKFQKIIPNSQSSFHLFIIRVKNNIRNNIYKKLRKNNISTNLHYIPIYRHSFYQKFNYNRKNFRISERYYKEAISLPIFYDLTYGEQKKIIDIINKTLKDK